MLRSSRTQSAASVVIPWIFRLYTSSVNIRFTSSKSRLFLVVQSFLFVSVSVACFLSYFHSFHSLQFVINTCIRRDLKICITVIVVDTFLLYVCCDIKLLMWLCVAAVLRATLRQTLSVLSACLKIGTFCTFCHFLSLFLSIRSLSSFSSFIFTRLNNV